MHFFLYRKKIKERLSEGTKESRQNNIFRLIENILARRYGLTTLLFNGIISVPMITIIIFLISMLCTFIISRVSILEKYVL